MWACVSACMTSWRWGNPLCFQVCMQSRCLESYLYKEMSLALHRIQTKLTTVNNSGDGASHTRVKFRMLVFRPDLEEVIVGKIKNCSKEGVHISLEFFDDILIPADSLQHPSRYDDSESVWIWEYPLEDDEHHDLYMDAGEQIR